LVEKSIPEMIEIPFGEIMLGSGLDEAERRFDESERRISIDDGICFSKFPITNKQYNAYRLASAKEAEEIAGLEEELYELPVVNVSYYDAVGYVAWLSKETGDRYRLPSEDEWEYAARGGTNTAFYCGGSITTEQANFNGTYEYNSETGSVMKKEGLYRKSILSVGQFEENAFGLFDMCGNIWEWTCSKWKRLSQTHTNLAEQQESFKSSIRMVTKGGAWNSGPGMLRSAYRGQYPAHFKLSVLGFRIVKDMRD